MSELSRALGVAAAAACVLLTGPASAQTVELATTVAFVEGPTSDREGNVYFTDIINQRIMKLEAAGALSIYREHSNAANGLLIDPQGRLVACEGATLERPGVKVTGIPRVTRTDLATGKVEILADSYEGKPLIGPNDVTIDSQGRLYFTELNGASVYRIDGPEKSRASSAHPTCAVPTAFRSHRTTRRCTSSSRAVGRKTRGRSGATTCCRTARSATRAGTTFFPGRSADGMSIDVQGNLYASAGISQLRGTSETLDAKTGVYVISPAGQLLKFIPISEDLISNNGFGGTDMKTLYVTAGKDLFKVRTDIAGLPR